jgi:hypothetical protein
MAYETWVGPTYLSTWAGTLGIATAQLPWLTALPMLGSLGQFLGVLLLVRATRIASLKGLCLTLTLLSRALWLIPLIAVSSSRIASSSPETWLMQVGVLAAISSAIGLTSTSFWMAWMRELIPERAEGEFWGSRSLWATIGVMSAHLISAVWLHDRPEASSFRVLLILALLCAGGSIWLLSRIPARASARASFSTPPQHQTKLPTALVFRQLLRPELRELLVFAGLLQGAMFLAGPYFPYYFTHEVGLDGSHVALWSLMTQAGAWISAGYWGRRMDQHGGVAFRWKNRPISVLQFGTCLMTLSPLPYVVSDASILQWIGPAEYFLNGVAWAAYTIGFNTLVFQRTRSSAFMSMALFSAQTAFQGILGASASWIGSGVLGFFHTNGFSILWISAAATRLVVVLFFCPRLAISASKIPHALQPVPSSESDLAHEVH